MNEVIKHHQHVKNVKLKLLAFKQKVKVELELSVILFGNNIARSLLIFEIF